MALPMVEWSPGSLVVRPPKEEAPHTYQDWLRFNAMRKAIEDQVKGMMVYNYISSNNSEGK